ncbi:WD40 repeat-like-containing domain [Fusarium albosuccineum]|uniref:WD40 repeat-like-containing domain n=1 Tax=Fusarium albosuccineum TaxID=1237068 RepID=A0A8H4L283_9HYPO|nr:WD40 repeat-like-containing domain [Fusarium albosuccineum]
MPCYSSWQLFQDWRYAIDKDFVTSEGEPFPYADNGKRQWGSEIERFPFDEEPQNGCVSSDGTRLAIAVGQNIHVFDTETWGSVCVLKGHTSRIDGLAFKPNDANTLVSSEESNYGATPADFKPATIVWDIDKAKNAPAPEDTSLGGAGAAAATAAVGKLEDLGVKLTEDDKAELEKSFLPDIIRAVAKRNVADNTRIHARLNTSFQSENFSPSGKQMAYLPGDRPHSNGNAPWDIEICSTDNFEHVMTLKGHTDAIMWTGWSPDETLFASVAWDGTIRIWDAVEGREIHRFETDHQNWTGAFSSDSQYFVATGGSGTVRVYALRQDDTLHWEFKAGDRDPWRRTVSWHPDGKLIAVGGEDRGEILLLDIEKKEVIQKRMLSTAAGQVDDEELRSTMGGFIGVSEVRFVDRGNKLAVWAHGDSSIEVFDINQQVKWRFARGGTEDGPGADKWRDEKGKVTNEGGSGMVVWEQRDKGQLFLASLDFDAVRIWAVPLTADGVNDH